MARQRTTTDEEPMPGGTEPVGFRAWVWEEAKDHLFPWGPNFLRQRKAVQAAGIALAVFVTLAWILAASGRIGSAAVIAWWVAWSVYEVICRSRCKPWIKQGPWWGRQRRRATLPDLIFYVATKNLLIGAALFLVLALIGVIGT